MPRHKAASKALKPTSHSPKPARVFFYYSSDSEAGDDDFDKDHKSDNSEEYDEDDEHADYDLPPVLHKPPVSGAGLQFAVHYKLPGPIQTVPRAELSAIVSLAEYLADGACVTYFGDNKKIIDMVCADRIKAKTSANHDLFLNLSSL